MIKLENNIRFFKNWWKGVWWCLSFDFQFYAGYLSELLFLIRSNFAPFTNVCTITRTNSCQLFPNLEATCHLLCLSTPSPQGTKLSGLLKLWLNGFSAWNFSGKNREIGTIISFFFKKKMATGHISLSSSYMKVTLLYWSKQEWACLTGNSLTGALFWFLFWTLALRLLIFFFFKCTKCEFFQDTLLMKCC